MSTRTGRDTGRPAAPWGPPTTTPLPSPVGAHLLPSHVRRAQAFVTDLTVVAVVFGLAVLLGKVSPLSTAGFLVVATAVWGYYVGVTAWLMEGQSAGKVILGLQVVYPSGSGRTGCVGGLVRAVARHTVAYVVVDVCLLGVATALADPRRRCLHDFGFGTHVVPVASAPPDPEGFLDRYRAYWEEFSDRYDALAHRHRWLFWPWRWLSRAVVVVAVIVTKWSPTESASPARADAGPTALRWGHRVAVLTTTTAATTAVVVVATQPEDDDLLDLSGTWTLTELRSENDGFVTTQDYEGSQLVFERVGDRFHIVDGPPVFVGGVLEPERIDEDGVLARSEIDGRRDCVDGETGELVAPDAYRHHTTWEFLDVERLPGEAATLHFVLEDRAVLDSDDPRADGCRPRALFEVEGRAVLEAGGLTPS